MKRKYPNENDQKDLILDTQEQLDVQTAESLGFFKLFSEALFQQQEVELDRLTYKYGSNDPRVVKLSAKMKQRENVGKAVDLRLNILKYQSEPLPDDGWRLQGYVYSAAGETHVGLTVMIGIKRDEKKELTRSAPKDGSSSATTDDAGFYSITLTAEELKKTSQYELYLIVLDRRRQVIYTSKDKLDPVPGEIDIQDAIIPNAQEPVRPKKTTRGKGRRK